MNKKTIIKFILIVSFLSFLITYVIGMSGYYEYELANKRILTEDKMKEFEEDVKNNKNVDLNGYMVDTHIDYTNKFTRGVNKASLTLNKYIKKSFETAFNALSQMIND